MRLHQYLSLKKKNLAPKATILDNCDVMPLHNYKMYLQTNDLRWLTKEFVLVTGLDDAMDRLYGDIFLRTKNTAILSRFGKLHKVMKLRGTYNVAVMLIGAIENYHSGIGESQLKELVEKLGELRAEYKLPAEMELYQHIENVKQQLPALLTQVEIIEAEVQQDDKGEDANIDQQVLLIEKALDLRYAIDQKETMLSRWLEMVALAKQQQESRGREQNQRSRNQRSPGRA
jgi:hypothetical protein